MSNPPTTTVQIVGREDSISRYTARLAHFRFFLYEGLGGIGKTAMMCRLAEADLNPTGLRPIYILMQPSEGVGSILARVCARVQVDVPQGIDLQGDLYARLVDLLDKERLLLLLDDIHHLPRTDMLALIHSVCRAKAGQFRVLAATSIDPQLNAMERSQLYVERVGPLPASAVTAMFQAAQVEGEAWGTLVNDAARGGALAQPLTARYVLGLGAPEVLTGVLASQSARSVHALRQVLTALDTAWDPALRACLKALCRVGVPVEAGVARAALGEAVDTLVARGLVDVINDDIHVHALVQQYVGVGPFLTGHAAATLATHLQDRATRLGESYAILRAAEILAHAGMFAEAVQMLGDGWQRGHDPGFFAAYLRTLAQIPIEGPMQARVRLLSLQARLQQGQVQNATSEVEALSQADDVWTRERALACAVQLHGARQEYSKVIEAFAALQAQKPAVHVLLACGMSAVDAMVHALRLPEAVELAHKLLASIGDDQKDEAPLRMLLCQVEAQRGDLIEAVREGQRAAACFAAASDWYHVATAHHFIGDLLRAAGEFQSAKQSFGDFLQAAQKSGDRDLTQLAELADAWVSLDIGDVVHAAKSIAAVQSNLGQAPSRRLLRYLAAAQALLEAGRGHHDKAASLLEKVVQSWRAAREQSLTGKLQAQWIRSLIACDRLDEAQAHVEQALSELNPQQHGPHIAALLRETALIQLRRGSADTAMELLGQARDLFAKTGNKREEAQTLQRIAHAALDEGNVELATQTTDEAMQLATQINHFQVQARAHELHARLALLQDRPDDAVTHGREALTALRRLGDDLGVLHASETLLRAYVHAGDVAAALRLGPKVRAHAQRAEVIEVRLRASALCGVALLRRERPDLAVKTYRDLDGKNVSLWTRSLMGRFGEALAWATGEQGEALRRRSMWLDALRRMPAGHRAVGVVALQQLALAPRDRCEARQRTGKRLLGTEEMALLDPKDHDLFVDVLYRRIYDAGTLVPMPSPQWSKLVMRATVASPLWVPLELVQETLGLTGTEKAVAKKAHKELMAIRKVAPNLTLEWTAKGVRLAPMNNYAFLLPVWMTQGLNDAQKTILKLLRKVGAAGMQAIVDTCKLSKAVARRELDGLTKQKLVEAVREGRTHVYRLS